MFPALSELAVDQPRRGGSGHGCLAGAIRSRGWGNSYTAFAVPTGANRPIPHVGDLQESVIFVHEIEVQATGLPAPDRRPGLSLALLHLVRYVTVPRLAPGASMRHTPYRAGEIVGHEQRERWAAVVGGCVRSSKTSPSHRLYAVCRACNARRWRRIAARPAAAAASPSVEGSGTAANWLLWSITAQRVSVLVSTP